MWRRTERITPKNRAVRTTRCEENEATQLHDSIMLQRGLGMLPQQGKCVGSALSAHMHHLLQLLRGPNSVSKAL